MRNRTLVTTLTVALCCGIATGVYAAKGSLKIAGSNTLLPASQLVAEWFMEKNTDTSISVSGGGTGQGFTGLLNGTCDIGAASREAKPKEIATAREKNIKLVATKVARDGIAIIVNSSNSIRTLTIKQISDIYSGRAATWNDVGGKNNGKILVVGRDSSSGTYGFFQDAVLGGKAYRSDMMTNPTTEAICQTVSQSKDAVGYAGIAYAEKFAEKNKVVIVAVSIGKSGSVYPDRATVLNGTYPLSRFLFFYTANSPRGLAKEFIGFALSGEGQKAVERSGYYRVK